MPLAFTCTHLWCWERKAMGHGLIGLSERESDLVSEYRPLTQC
jgi:hypothetical protein